MSEIIKDLLEIPVYSGEYSQFILALGDFTFKTTFLLVVTIFLIFVFRKKSAAFLHSLWAFSFIACLFIPVVSFLVPEWSLNIIPNSWVHLEKSLETSEIASNGEHVFSESFQLPEKSEEIEELLISEEQPEFNAQTSKNEFAATVSSINNESLSLENRPWFLMSFIWCIGVIVFLLKGFWNRILIWNLYLNSEPIQEENWDQSLNRVREKLSLQRKVKLRKLDRLQSPMISGIFRPTVFLPANAEHWGQDKRELILFHELAHAKRNDLLAQFLAKIVCMVCWFNPLCWYGYSQMRKLREYACDDLVLSNTPSASGYATVLLEIAKSCQHRTFTPAIGMMRNSQLENRISSLLDTTRNHLSMTQKGVALLIIMLTVSVFGIGTMQFGLAGQPSVKSELVSNLEPEVVNNETKKSETNDKEIESTETITGRVVTEEGKSVSGIEVKAIVKGEPWPEKIVTNKNGEFQVPANWEYRKELNSLNAVLKVLDEDKRMGWHVFIQNLNLNHREKPFEIVLLPRTKKVTGYFVDEEGKPLKGVRMTVISLFHKTNRHTGYYHFLEENWFRSIPSDKSGKFTLTTVESTRVRLSPDHPDWISTLISVREDDTDLGKIVLKQAGRIEGKVVNQNTGKPVIGHQLGVQALESDNLSDPTVNWKFVKTNSEGRFVIGGLPEGLFNVLYLGTIKTKTLTASAVEAVQVKAGQSVKANINVRRGVRLFGKVLDDQSGKPVKGINVGYYGSARPNSGASAMMRITEDDGSFEFYVPPGESKTYIAVSDRKHVTDSSRTVIVKEGEEFGPINLKVGPVHDVKDLALPEVIPTREKNAKPLPYELLIQFEVPEGKKFTQTVVNVIFKDTEEISAQTSSRRKKGSIEQSDFRFQEKDKGRKVFFIVDAKGFKTLKTDEITVSENIPVMTIKLEPEVRVPLSGRVLDSQGKPASNVRIRVRRNLYGGETGNVWSKNMEFPWGVEHLTDKDGKFKIEHVRIGDRVQIQADQESLGSARSNWIQVEGKNELVLPDLELAPGKKIGTNRTNDGAATVLSENVEYLIIPINGAKTDLQKTFASTEQGVDLLIDGTGIVSEDGKIDGRLIWMKKLQELLRSYNKTNKDILNVHIYYPLVGEGMAKDILMWSFEGFGRNTGFRKTKVYNHYQGEGFQFAEYINSKKNILEVADEGDEPVNGNELVKVYPVRTSLSRSKFNNADCVVDILPSFEKGGETSISPELEQAIQKYVSRLTVKQKKLLFFRISSKGEGGSTVDWFIARGSKEIAKKLGYQSVVVNHTPR